MLTICVPVCPPLTQRPTACGRAPADGGSRLRGPRRRDTCVLLSGPGFNREVLRDLYCAVFVSVWGALFSVLILLRLLSQRDCSVYTGSTQLQDVHWCYNNYYYSLTLYLRFVWTCAPTPKFVVVTDVCAITLFMTRESVHVTARRALSIQQL